MAAAARIEKGGESYKDRNEGDACAESRKNNVSHSILDFYLCSKAPTRFIVLMIVLILTVSSFIFEG